LLHAEAQTDTAQSILAFRNFANTLKNDSTTSNNMGNWDNFKIIHTITEQHTRKVRNQKSSENSHISHSTHASKSTDVEAQYVYHGK
jgi:hypothetical protein